MQYLFQSVNFRSDPSSKPYTDLLQDVGTEEISQVDLIGTNIGRLLDGSPVYQGKEFDPIDQRGAEGGPRRKIPQDNSNFTIIWPPRRGALTVDAAGTRGRPTTAPICPLR